MTRRSSKDDPSFATPPAKLLNVNYVSKGKVAEKEKVQLMYERVRKTVKYFYYKQ